MAHIRIVSLFIIVGLFIGFSSCKKKDKKEPDTPSQVFSNESYGTDPRHVMDVHLPENRSMDSTKVVILIHGGGWTSGNKSDFNGLMTTIKKNLPHYAVININYRLCSDNPYTNGFPAQEEDVIQAIEYIKTKRSEWQISDKFTLVGASAGAHLALLHAYKNNADHTVKAVAAYFPPTDLANGYDAFPASKTLIEFVTGGTPADVPQIYFESSPINYTATAIPTILFHGTNDNIVPVQQTTWLRDSLVSKAKTVDAWIIPAQGHGFTAATSVETIERIGNFFRTNNP